jgi:hypothetical protein
VPVGPDLAALAPERFADLRRISSTRTLTARPPGEPPFPALLLERTESYARVYDLTGPLPVLRTFRGGLELTPAVLWRHEAAAGIYTARELELIGRYLRRLTAYESGR